MKKYRKKFAEAKKKKHNSNNKTKKKKTKNKQTVKSAKPKLRNTRKHMNTTPPPLAPLIYTPSFFSLAKATGNFKPDIAGAMHEGIRYGKEHKLISAQQMIKNGIAHALMMTDLQEDFCDDGRLPVKGTFDVVTRVCTRLINGIVTDHFGGIIFSLDGHPPWHISFDVSWYDQHGNALDLSKHGKACIMVLMDEGKAVFKATAFNQDGPYEVGYYQPRFDPKKVVEYWKHLQATNQGPIWVFVPHCVLGTNGTNLHPLLVETLAFACGARSMQPTIISKGHLADRDWFGPLEPCWPDPNHPQGGFQKEVIDVMKKFKGVEFSGVAEDFCDFNMKRQTMEKLTGTEFMAKLAFLTDCTAPIVPNAPQVLKLNTEAEKAGIRFINHATPFMA